MKKFLVLTIIICITFIVSGQNNDLIVTVNGDSVACEILEVNDSEIIFKMKYDNKDAQTMMNINEIEEFQYDVVQKGMYRYKSGTSYITEKVFTNSYPISSQTYSIEYLQSASDEELEYYFYKAQRLQRTGKTLNIVGVSTFGVSMLSLFATSDAWGMGALLFTYPAMAGLGVLAVGIPVNVTGKKRVERINSIKNTAFNDIRINLQPCAQYNLATQNYQPALTLNIRF